MVDQWYFIPPPYDQETPISINAPPLGALRTGSHSPYDTIQIVGRSRKGRIPKSVTIDLGWTDILVTDGKHIEFQSKGETTDVGTRLPSPTRGMSVEDIGERLDVEPFEEAPARRGVNRPTMGKKKPAGRGVNRATMRKKKPKRKGKRLTDYEYMTTLKGFVP